MTRANSKLRAATNDLDALIKSTSIVRVGGQIIQANATGYRVAGLQHRVRVGDCVQVDAEGKAVVGQVVHVRESFVTIEAYDAFVPVGLGNKVWSRGPLTIRPSSSWKGRVINPLGAPIDDKGELDSSGISRSTEGLPPSALHRSRIESPLKTGLKIVDIFTPLCTGQRIGIFAGSGVGKSTLLGMLARASRFQTVVVSLVGERGREVREFVEDVLGERAASAVTVVATGDEGPLMRRQAPLTAMTIAEHFRDQGESVLLIVDSITRYAHALREVALAAGEPPVARGYTPSVFTQLPRLLERAGPGRSDQGTITALLSVLVDGDDHNDPVADAVRGILDGHIVLTREIAVRGQFPAVDVLQSLSRLSDKATTADEARFAKSLRAMIALFEDSRDLRQLGAYKAGGNPELDRAVHLVPRVYTYLSQTPQDAPVPDPFKELANLLSS